MSTSRGNNSSKSVVYMRKNPPQQGFMNQSSQNLQSSHQFLQTENVDQTQGQKVPNMYFNQQDQIHQTVQNRDPYNFNSLNSQSQNCYSSTETSSNIYKSNNQSSNQNQTQVKIKQKLSQSSNPFSQNQNENNQQSKSMSSEQIKTKMETQQLEKNEQKNSMRDQQNNQNIEAQDKSNTFEKPFIGLILLNASETSCDVVKKVYFIVINQKEVKIQDHYEFSVSSQEDELQDMQDHFQVISQKIDFYFTKAEEGFIMSYASKQVKTLLKQFKLQFLEHEINKEAIFIDQIIPEKYTKIQNNIQLNQLMEDLEMNKDTNLQEKIKILSYFNNEYSTNIIKCILKIISQGFYITQVLSSGWRQRNKFQTKIMNLIRQNSKVNNETQNSIKNQMNQNQSTAQENLLESLTNINNFQQKSGSLSLSKNSQINDDQAANVQDSQQKSGSLSSSKDSQINDDQVANNQDSYNQEDLSNDQETQKDVKDEEIQKEIINQYRIYEQQMTQKVLDEYPSSSQNSHVQNINQKIEQQFPQQIQEQQNQQILNSSVFRNDTNQLNQKSITFPQQNQNVERNQFVQQANQDKIEQESEEKKTISSENKQQINKESQIMATPISQSRTISQNIQLRNEIKSDLNLIKSSIDYNQKKLNSSFTHNNEINYSQKNTQLIEQKQEIFECDEQDIIEEIKKEIIDTQQLSDSVANMKENLISQINEQQQFLTNFVSQQNSTIQTLRQKQGILFEFIVNLNQDTENLIQQQQSQLTSFQEDFNKKNKAQQELIMNEIKSQDNKFNNHLQSLQNLAKRVQYTQEVKQTEIQQQQQAMQEASRLLLDCSQALLNRNPLTISQMRESIYQQSFLQKSATQINDFTPIQTQTFPGISNICFNQSQSQLRHNAKNYHSDNEQTDKERINSFSSKIERSQKDSLSCSFQSQKNQLQKNEQNLLSINGQNNSESTRQQNVIQKEQLRNVSDQDSKNSKIQLRESEQRQVETQNLSQQIGFQTQQIQISQKNLTDNILNTVEFNNQSLIRQQEDKEKTQTQFNNLSCQQDQTNQQNKDLTNVNKLDELNNYIQNMNTPDSDIFTVSKSSDSHKINQNQSAQNSVNNQNNQQVQVSENNIEIKKQEALKQIEEQKKEMELLVIQNSQMGTKIIDQFQQKQNNSLPKNEQESQVEQEISKFQKNSNYKAQKASSDNEKEIKSSFDSSNTFPTDTKNNVNLNHSQIQSSDISVQVNTVLTKPSTSELSTSHIKSADNLIEENISCPKKKKKLMLKKKLDSHFEPFLPNEQILQDFENQKKEQTNNQKINNEIQVQQESQNRSLLSKQTAADQGQMQETLTNLNMKQSFQTKNLSQFIEEQQKKRKESIKELQESFQSSNNSSQLFKSDNLILQSELFEQPKKSIFEGNGFMYAIYQQTLEAEKRVDQNSKISSKKISISSELKKIVQGQEIKQRQDKIENSKKKIRISQDDDDDDDDQRDINSQNQLNKDLPKENVNLNVQNADIKYLSEYKNQSNYINSKQEELENDFDKFEMDSNYSTQKQQDQNSKQDFEDEQYEHQFKEERSNHSEEDEENDSQSEQDDKTEKQNFCPQDKVLKQQFLKPPSSTSSLQQSSSLYQQPIQNQKNGSYPSCSSSYQKTLQNLGSLKQKAGQPTNQLEGFDKSTFQMNSQLEEKQIQKIDSSQTQYTLQKIQYGEQNQFNNHNNSNRNKSTERRFSSNKNKKLNCMTNTSNHKPNYNMRHNSIQKDNQGYSNNKNSKYRSHSSQEHYYRVKNVEYIDKRKLISQDQTERKISDNGINLTFNSQSLSTVVQEQHVQNNTYHLSSEIIDDDDEKLNSSIISRQTEMEYNNIYDLIKTKNRMSPKEISQVLKNNSDEVQLRLKSWQKSEEQIYAINTQNLQSTSVQAQNDIRKKKLTKSTVQMLIVLQFQLNQSNNEIIQINSVIINTDRHQTIDQFTSFVKPVDMRINSNDKDIQYTLRNLQTSHPFEVVFAKLCNFFKPYLDNYKCCILYDQEDDSEILYKEFVNKQIIPCPKVLEIFYTCIFLSDIFPSSLNTKTTPVKNYNQAMDQLQLKKHFTKKHRPIEIKNFENVITTLLTKGVVISSKDVKCAFTLDQLEKKVQKFINQCKENFEMSQNFLILEFQHGKYNAYNQIENSALRIQILQKTTGFSFIHIDGMYGFSYDFYRNDISAFYFFFLSYLNALKINQNQLSLLVLEEDNILANQVIELMFPHKTKPNKIILLKEVQTEIQYNLEKILQKNTFSFNFEKLFSTLCGQGLVNNQNMFQM